MTYRAFTSAMRTSSRPYSQRRSESFTDRDWEKKKDEYERRANSAHAREMNQIMRGRK